MKQMIYHVPYVLNQHAKTGSGLRPLRMLEAFKEIGFNVTIVAGDSTLRRRAIADVKARIKSGERFEFLYSESHTMPTALTDPDHLPRHPAMDASFLRYCRKREVKVGLFYRDIYWRFPEYRERLNPIVHTATRALYHWDLLAYKAGVDVLYLPSLGMGDFVPHVPAKRHVALPPGAETKDLPTIAGGGLELFYVGGLGGYYKMHDTVRAVAASASARLTICTPEAEWAAHGAEYQALVNERITIIHKSGVELEPYYAKAAACMLFIEPSVYRSFAAPIKYAEYIGFGKPVIVNEGTNVAGQVQEHGNGWVLPFDGAALEQLLNELTEFPERVTEATAKTLAIRDQNTWVARARQVAEGLARN
ncbi:glycosyltransferase family protein [Arthrobacter sp. Sr24]